MLRAVSLPRPHANLISHDQLAIFTRPWRSPYNGTLAVHAVCPGRNIPISQMKGCRLIVATAPLVGLVEYSNVTWDDDDVEATTWKIDVDHASLPKSQRELLLTVQPEPERWLYILGDITRTRVGCGGRSGAGLWVVPPELEELCVEAPPY